MDFEGLQARYRRLYREHAVWKLLRATNSVYILAFMEELFAELEGEENVYFEDKQGLRFTANMPKFLIDASLFPQDMGTLNL